MKPLLLLLIAAALLCGPAPAAERPPNIVFIMADDLGSGDIKPGPLEIGFDCAFCIPATGNRVAPTRPAGEVTSSAGPTHKSGKPSK